VKPGGFMERAIQDLGAGLRYLRREGFEKIVLDDLVGVLTRWSRSH
jgi:hypothetical protein